MNSDFGRRLNVALGRRSRTMRWLSRELRKRKVTASSRTMLRRYREGEYDPPEEVVEAVAELLDFRVEWLKAGEGPATDAEAEEWVRSGPKRQRLPFYSIRDQELVRDLEPDERRAEALLRLGHELRDDETFATEEEHAEALHAAAVFLRGADEARLAARRVLAEPPTHINYAQWAEDTLAAFLREEILEAWGHRPIREED